MVFNEKGDPSAKDDEMVLINPEITSTSPEEDVHEEGCLSFPLIRGDVRRPKTIGVKYSSLDGEQHERILEGWPARIFQHEYDHLNKVRTSTREDTSFHYNNLFTFFFIFYMSILSVMRRTLSTVQSVHFSI